MISFMYFIFLQTHQISGRRLNLFLKWGWSHEKIKQRRADNVSQFNFINKDQP